MQVLVCGAELYTSNAALMPVAFYEKKASLQQVICCYTALKETTLRVYKYAFNHMTAKDKHMCRLLCKMSFCCRPVLAAAGKVLCFSP